jgi:hypothetical protein
MKFLKLVLTMAMLGIAAATYATAQVKRQTTSDVNKAKTSSPVNNDTAPQYYELRCRGGTNLDVAAGDPPPVQRLRFAITQGRRTEATNEQMMNMTVTFIAGTQPVSVSGDNLQIGRCSWLDRGFRPGEPTQIRQEIVYFGQSKQAQHGTPIDRSLTAAERHPDSINVPQYLEYPDHYWSFFVRNTGLGYFEATSSRYWKPLKIDQEIRTPPSKVPAEVKKPMR